MIYTINLQTQAIVTADNPKWADDFGLTAPR